MLPKVSVCQTKKLEVKACTPVLTLADRIGFRYQMSFPSVSVYQGVHRKFFGKVRPFRKGGDGGGGGCYGMPIGAAVGAGKVKSLKKLPVLRIHFFGITQKIII